ncbi:hypothetical protein G5B46_14795 [Caulobacter sp. 602-2]|uniref:Uncharacterized protein n=1 Tax=Caulobacter sp. 602-2 TaxID=2710887 RepID=A0A6G4QZJ8_9CAUL|nr:hypothetical protein [Caulobacter sp. 602-2]NGM50879.1 hypothetical protein [Caulobacter sp. 602-2]
MAIEVDQAIADYPAKADTRYLQRLTDQQRRLANPDLELIGAVAVSLHRADPSVRAEMQRLERSISERPPFLGRRSSAPTPTA